MSSYKDEIRAVLSQMDNGEQQEQQTPPEDIKDIYVLIVRETEEGAEDQSNIVESTPAPATTQHDSFLSAYVFVCFSMFLILTTLTFQL